MRLAHEVSATNFLTKSSKDYAGFSNFHGCGPSMKANTGDIFCSAFRMVSFIGLTQKRYSSLLLPIFTGNLGIGSTEHSWFREGGPPLSLQGCAPEGPRGRMSPKRSSLPKPASNHGVQATANSLRSAAAIGGA